MENELLRLNEFPLEDLPKEEELELLRSSVCPFLHPAGKCRMGVDGKEVVGPDLSVRGVNRLWVADSSVFPAPVAGNINATTMMVAERASELIPTWKQ